MERGSERISQGSPFVSSIVVYGAGEAAVNGLYMPDGMYEQVQKYAKRGFWDDKECVFSIAAFRMRSEKKIWHISIVDSDQPGTDNDTDFYKCSGLARGRDVPPAEDWIALGTGNAPPPKIKYCRNHPGANAAIEPYEKLLFLKKFSDVTFVCQDGEEIPAHKLILAEVSPYFDSMFCGPWKEAQNGRLQTDHTASIIKELLTILYTGQLDQDEFLHDPFAWMSVAHEYSIDWLLAVAEDCCIQAFILRHYNIGDLWQVGHRFGNEKIKNICLFHVKKSLIDIFQTSCIRGLKIEDPESWKALAEATANEDF